MKTLEDVYIDSVIMTNQIKADKELYEIMRDYFEEEIDVNKYGYKMMELALKRGRKIELLNAHATPKCFDKDTNTFNRQKLADTTIKAAMEIPALEAVFANARPDEYFQQILAVAIHQNYVLEKIEKDLHL